MPGSRKGSIQIRFEILEYLYYNPKPQLRTHIWRKSTTLSYDDFQKHLLYLVNKKLIEDNDIEGCSITSEGRIIYEKLRNTLKELL